MTSNQQNNGPDKLVNLGLKAGDVVRLMDSDPHTVEDRAGGLRVVGKLIETLHHPRWTVVSRASDAKPDPYDLSNPDKLTFEEMPDAMKGAMLLANYRGEVIQFWHGSYWKVVAFPSFAPHVAYRVKPKAPDDIVLYGIMVERGCKFRPNGPDPYDNRKITLPVDENSEPLVGTFQDEDGREIIVEAV